MIDDARSRRDDSQGGEGRVGPRRGAGARAPGTEAADGEVQAWPRSAILVEMELPRPGALSPRLVELLGSLRVVLVGWYRVPEQTPPGQARSQEEAECTRVLSRVAEGFRNAGAEVDARLVFTPDPLVTAARVAEEEGCDAVLLARPVTKLERVLVSLRGPHNVRRIAAFLADLLVGSSARVYAIHIHEEGEDEGLGIWVLAELKDRLLELGLEPERVEVRTVSEGDPAEVLVRRAAECDVLVLGESEPTMADLLFSSFSERVAESVDVPVFVIRQRHQEAGEASRPPSS